MPVIRCQKCDRAFDIPAEVAVELPSSIARCACGEWLSNSKAELLARRINPDQLRELDLLPYQVGGNSTAAWPAQLEKDEDPFDLGHPLNVRVVARTAAGSINTIFAVAEHPLWIGRSGCHVELDDTDLSIRHCSIVRRGGELVVRDGDSYTGTFLDGESIAEAVIGEGTHILRVGSAIICLEPTMEPGVPVETIKLEADSLLEGSPLLLKKLQQQKAKSKEVFEASRVFLVCLEGPLAGQEFEIPLDGLVVGREGSVRVPDEYLSRRHFEVRPDPDGAIRVRDLGSRNGTFLNTLPARNTRVHKGDEIRAGLNRFRIEERS